MKILLTVLVSLITSLLGAFFFLSYAPNSWFDHQKPTFGSAVTTILGTDTLSASRTTINNNFSALNTGKFELSDWFATTSAQQVTKLGTITTGNWNATPITAQYGGTGSSTLSQYQILLGNGTGNVTVPVGWGSAGQVLISAGAGAIPTWSSGSVDTTQSYNWTGTSFLVKNLAASSTVANPLTLNKLTYNFASLRAGSSTVLMEDGSGNLSWVNSPILLNSNQPGLNSVTSQNSTTTLATAVIPANTLGANTKSLRVTANYMNASNAGNCFFSIELGTGSASTSVAYSGAMAASNAPGITEAWVTSTTTTATYTFSMSKSVGGTLNSIAAPTELDQGSLTVYAPTSQLYLAFRGRTDASSNCTLVGETVEVLNK